MTIAYWCVLIAALLPYLAVVLAKARAGYDNRMPRAWLAKLGGWRARAHAAQLNSFETFPVFAAAVIIAHLAHAPQGRIDALAAAFVIARLVYIAFYIADRAALRSLVWALGMACVIGLFVISA